MATLTIRNVPDEVVDRIKSCAETAGRSMEQEVRTLLEARYASRKAVLSRIRSRWAEWPRVKRSDVSDWKERGRSADR
ncbi:MAG: hypothetical protein AAF735_04125 [Myxococcota bacterium]